MGARMKTVIELGREAGYYFYDLTETHGVKTAETDEADTWVQLERFAELVRADEREACAKLVEQYDIDIAEKIRARSNT